MYVYDAAHSGPFARRLAEHEAPRHRVNGPGLADREGIDMTQGTDALQAERERLADVIEGEAETIAGFAADATSAVRLVAFLLRHSMGDVTGLRVEMERDDAGVSR